MALGRRAIGLFAALLALACDELPPESAGVAPDASVPTPDVCSQPSPPSWCMPMGVDGGSSCVGGNPDGLCDSSVQSLESCSCPDCASAARCTGACVDDGFCALGVDGGAAEDCTCADCSEKVLACAHPSVGCVDDGLCSPMTDDCTCVDCATDEACFACVDNGVCVPFDEGCSCSDCVSGPSCVPPDGGADAGDASDAAM